jgi:hypothetical protein
MEVLVHIQGHVKRNLFVESIKAQTPYIRFFVSFAFFNYNTYETLFRIFIHFAPVY